MDDIRRHEWFNLRGHDSFCYKRFRLVFFSFVDFVLVLFCHFIWACSFQLLINTSLIRICSCCFIPLDFLFQISCIWKFGLFLGLHLLSRMFYRISEYRVQFSHVFSHFSLASSLAFKNFLVFLLIPRAHIVFNMPNSEWTPCLNVTHPRRRKIILWPAIG